MILTSAPPRSMAGITAYKNRAALEATLHAEFGAAPPAPSTTIQTGTGTLSCLSPTRYFATADRDAALPTRLAKSLAGIAAVTDQSDLWATYIVSGEDIRDELARLVPIDLNQFPIGRLALTRAHHLDVRIHHIAELTYEVAVTRSFADDLLAALVPKEGLLF